MRLGAGGAASFRASGKSYGSPRVFGDLIAEGCKVSVRRHRRGVDARQGLVARPRKGRMKLASPDKTKRRPARRTPQDCSPGVSGPFGVIVLITQPSAKTAPCQRK